MALVVVLFGCRGENLSGRWRGPFPLEDAKDCVLNLYSDERFDLACSEHVWLGGGHYHVADDRLSFTFEVLARRENPVARLPKVDAQLVGKGNEIELKITNGDSYKLVRHM